MSPRSRGRGRGSSASDRGRAGLGRSVHEVVLVTGGAGFIGSHLVEALVGGGRRVRVLDDLSTGRRRDVHPAAELVIGDITDSAVVRAAMVGVRAVAHLAARRAVPRSFVDPAGTDRVNRIGTAVVLDEAGRAGVERVVFASSSSVYGNAVVAPTPEDAVPGPLSPYAASKLAGETLCRTAAASGLDTVCLRYFNVYGPNQRPDGPYATLIPLVVDALSRGRCITVHGDGRQCRDFTYVDDAVRATITALDAPEAFAGASINVAGGNSYSVLDVVGCVAEALDVTPRLAFSETRRGDPRRTEADLTLAWDRLGYRPTVTLDQGVRRVIASLDLLTTVA